MSGGLRGTMTAAAKTPNAWPSTRRRFPIVSECTLPAEQEVCPHKECRYHLAHRSRWEHALVPTRDCALSVANEGDEVALAFGMSKERVRQLEESAFEKLKGSALRRFYDESE
jgi:hypothetical protein